MCDRPLASKHPSLDDYIPINISKWESSSTIIHLLKRRLSDRCSRKLSPDSFEREANACYLLSKTLDWRCQGEDSSCIQAVAAPLQDFLSHLMDPVSGTKGTFYSATSIAII